MTNGGRAKYAIALSASGDKAKAEQWARRAWREGPLTDDDENRLFQMMDGRLTAADHDARVSRLLWSSAARSAQKWLPYTSADRRAVLEAQLAHELKSADAAAKFAAAGQAGQSDAGLIMERVNALKAAGNTWGARELLANRPALNAPPHVARDWLKLLLANAEAAEKDGQYDLAYRISSKLRDAFPAGTKIIELDLQTRDVYTSLAWLAGETAYYKLGRPRDAIDMFRAYTDGARTPQTRSKGLYWAGRAAKQAGDTAAPPNTGAKLRVFTTISTGNWRWKPWASRCLQCQQRQPCRSYPPVPCRRRLTLRGFPPMPFRGGKIRTAL